MALVLNISMPRVFKIFGILVFVSFFTIIVSAQLDVSVPQVETLAEETSYTRIIESNGHSLSPVISADGRFVAFVSHASNLVANDTNNAPDAFVHDRETGETMRVSIASDGAEANNGVSAIGAGREISISADGRFVTFVSRSSNLVDNDTNNQLDVFVHDRETGETTRVSIASDGTEANGLSLSPVITADGRFVAFTSAASNLVEGDTNGALDVFMHDRETGDTFLVSVNSNGEQSNFESRVGDISADGRFVAFSSFGTNLVADDTNGLQHTFVHDRDTGQTVRISGGMAGTEATLNLSGIDSEPVGISADGRYVAFWSWSSNLVEEDTNDTWDLFLYDLETEGVILVSIASDGTQGNNATQSGSISADGRFIAFASLASNLVSSDTNRTMDIFVHDRETGETSIISTSTDGMVGNGGSQSPSISADGRFVAFASLASNLVSSDTNNQLDVFVHDRETGETTRVSIR